MAMSAYGTKRTSGLIRRMSVIEDTAETRFYDHRGEFTDTDRLISCMVRSREMFSQMPFDESS